MLFSHANSKTQDNSGRQRFSKCRRLSPIVPKKNTAATALKLAQEAGWNDYRLSISLNSFADALQMQSPYEVQNIFQQIRSVFQNMFAGELNYSFFTMQVAHFYVSLSQGQEALNVIVAAIRVGGAYENAALVSVFMFFKAEALELVSKWEEARKVRLDTFENARYELENIAEIRRYMRRISSLKSI